MARSTACLIPPPPIVLGVLIIAANVVTMAVGLSLTPIVSAQARPDFSGRWTTDPDPAAAAAAARGGAAGQRGVAGAAARSGDMGSGWGSPITITQDAARLTVEYMFFTSGDMQPPLRFIYALDGSETKNAVMMGRGIQSQLSKTAWDGNRLVITTVHTFPNPDTGKPMATDVKQTLSLESPTSLVVETTRAGVLGGPATTVKSTYRKL